MGTSEQSPGERGVTSSCMTRKNPPRYVGDGTRICWGNQLWLDEQSDGNRRLWLEDLHPQ